MPKERRPCSRCGETVERYPSQMPDGDVFCSRSCSAKGREPANKSENVRECAECGDTFHSPPSAERVVCSRECYHERSARLMSGRENHNWMERAGFVHADFHGYERAVCAGSDEAVKIHRLAAVAWFGYEAVVENDIHHTTRVPWDNREDSLEPLSKSDHAALHAAER